MPYYNLNEGLIRVQMNHILVNELDALRDALLRSDRAALSASSCGVPALTVAS
jgi:hypothetical protein